MNLKGSLEWLLEAVERFKVFRRNKIFLQHKVRGERGLTRGAWKAED